MSKEAGLPIEMEFAPSVFRKTTQAIYINWGFMPQFAEVVIDPEHGFVSPTEVPNKPAPAATPENPGRQRNHQTGGSRAGRAEALALFAVARLLVSAAR